MSDTPKTWRVDEYLQSVHAKDYVGTDDDMTDDYNNWLVELQVDDWLNSSEEALSQELQAQKKRVLEIVEEVGNTESDDPNKRTKCCDYHQALSDISERIEKEV